MLTLAGAFAVYRFHGVARPLSVVAPVAFVMTFGVHFLDLGPVGLDERPALAASWALTRTGVVVAVGTVAGLTDVGGSSPTETDAAPAD